MAEWTENRKRVAGFLQEYVSKHGRAPSLEEIAGATGLWKRSVEIVLKGLEKIGFIEITPGISRGIRIVDQGLARVPLLGEVHAGTPALSQEEAPEFLKIDKSFVSFRNPFALRVEGYSMKDAGILPGDIILLRNQDSAENGDTIVAFHNGGYTVKTIEYKGKRIFLRPANPSYKAIEIRKEDEFSIIGKVMIVLRDLGGCFNFKIEKARLN